MMMRAVTSSETSVSVYQILWHSIPEGIHLRPSSYVIFVGCVQMFFVALIAPVFF
jgi:hypothetical protein